MSQVFVAEPSQYPLQLIPDFSKGVMKDENGSTLRNKAGKAIMEKDLCIAYRAQYKQYCKNEYGEKWKSVFYHGHLPSSN